MATLSTFRPTLIDVARATDPTGKIAQVAEVIMQFNDILDDIPWMEGNLATGNLSTIRTSYASPSLRSLNAGVVPTKSTTGQINDACSILENRNEVDVNVANLNGNAAAYRAKLDMGMIQGFGEALAEHLIYGNSADNPAEFNGFASRYFSFGTTYATSNYMIDAGGTGSDNTSIWLINWGPNKVEGLYPKGTQGGLKIEDLGIQDVLTNTSTFAKMRAYVTWMQWLCGLAVMDYRNVVRICNIDYSNLQTATDTSDSSANLLKLMSIALDMLPPDSGGTPVFYMRNDVRGYLRAKMNAKSNLNLSDVQVSGPNSITRRPGLAFNGVLCKRVDAITKTEATITVHNR